MCFPYQTINAEAAQTLLNEVGRVVDQAVATFAGDLSRMGDTASAVRDLMTKIKGANLTHEEAQIAFEEMFTRPTDSDRN
jgi:hypothetical protein